MNEFLRCVEVVINQKKSQWKTAQCQCVGLQCLLKPTDHISSSKSPALKSSSPGKVMRVLLLALMKPACFQPLCLKVCLTVPCKALRCFFVQLLHLWYELCFISSPMFCLVVTVFTSRSTLPIAVCLFQIVMVVHMRTWKQHLLFPLSQHYRGRYLICSPGCIKSLMGHIVQIQKEKIPLTE